MSMNRIFLIGDTHFSHAKIIQFESVARPFATIEEHDEALVERWNSVVKPKDTVWHLGDVLIGKGGFKYLSRLNGLKRLVLGNHDHHATALYAEHFTRMMGAAELRGCVLTHIPVHPSQFPRYRANIHGHLHSKSLDDPRYVCVSAEHNNLTPISLDEVMAKLPPMEDIEENPNDE